MTTVYRLNGQLPTHAYAHLLADVYFAGFAPAFTLSQCDSEYARKPQDAHSLGRWQQSGKRKKSL
jgi:hypothetical protein